MQVHTSRKSVVAAFALALGLTGCASAGGGGGSSGGSRNVLSNPDLIAVGEVDLYEAIQRLRRAWVTTRPGASEPVVYVDDTRRSNAQDQGSFIEELRAYNVRDVGRVEYVDGINATTRFGTDHGGGAILVSTGVTADAGSATSGGSAGGNQRPRDTENTRTAERHLEAGDDAGSPDEARTHYQQALTSAEGAIAENPQNPLGHRLAALASLGLEDYETAGAHFDHAAELWSLYEVEDAPTREQAYIDRYQEAAPLLQQAAYTEAAALLEDAHAIYPGRPEAAITLAQIYASERDHDRSLEYIDAAEAFFASDRMMEVDEATQEAWRAQGQGLGLMRAQVLVDAGRFEEAIPTYRAVAAAEPDNVSIQQDLAAILMQMDRPEEALAVYEEILARPDLMGSDFYRVGVGFYQVEDYGRAANAFAQGVDASPMDRDALEMWARSLQLDSAYVDVPPVAERWIELDPASQIALTVLAQAVNATGDGQRAGEIIGRVDDLSVTVADLQLRRSPNGGGTVTGSLTNKTLDQGAQVTLTFTFYSEAGSPLGTVTHSASVGAADMAEVFQIQFDSAEIVGGYGYEVSGG